MKQIDTDSLVKIILNLYHQRTHKVINSLL